MSPLVELHIVTTSCTASDGNFVNMIHCIAFLVNDESVLVCITTAPNGWNPTHDDVIKWKHFPRYWPFVRGIHRWPVNSPHKRPVTRSFDAFFDLRLNKRLSKQSWGWWFETPSCPLWRHSNVDKQTTTIYAGAHSTCSTQELGKRFELCHALSRFVWPVYWNEKVVNMVWYSQMRASNYLGSQRYVAARTTRVVTMIT